jgi:beta propeller repeat protein
MYNGDVYYGIYGFPVPKLLLLVANVSDNKQQYLWSSYDDGSEGFDGTADIAVFGNRVISTGGCDNSLIGELCVFSSSSPCSPVALTGSYYGGYNRIWGDVAVWFTFSGEDTFDIEGYNFTDSAFFYVTHDAETQLDPNIQGDTVVYMDLRFGDSYLDGNWNHSAVFAYDLTTEVTKQITSGEWIAAYPDVYDNVIVWSDYRASSNPNDAQSFDGVEIWGYNLTTETEFQITSLPGRPKQTPRIWGDKVFVHMSKASGGDGIFMFDLPDGAK